MRHSLVHSSEVLEDESPGGVCSKEGCEHQRLDSHQLDEDIERRSRGILERVTHSVSNDSSDMAS